MNEQVGVASAREFSNSAKDFDEVYRHTIQAIEYAKSIADSAQRLTAEALGMPRRDGKLRVDRILEISGQPAAEMAAESFVATYFMLADELAKLKDKTGVRHFGNSEMAGLRFVIRDSYSPANSEFPKCLTPEWETPCPDNRV